MAQDIDRFYQLCDPAQPLKPGDQRYVPCDDVRGDGDLVGQLARALRRSETPLHLLLTGHRGAGKSTELLRLEHRLSNPQDEANRFFVVYFEADKEDVDVNDVDFPDLLLAVIRQVGKALRERLGEELLPARLRRFWEDVKNLLGSEVNVEEVEFDAKIAKFTGTIRDSPNEREVIRKALEPKVSGLIDAANDLLDEAMIRLRARGYRGLVLIVDNLDRIILRQLNEEFNTHEQLFINRGLQLIALRCHVVYTLPISMVFSPRATALSRIFSRNPSTLPMVRVITRQGEDDEAGLEAMREMVRKRLHEAGATQDEAFDTNDTLDYLCRMSGGHARSLFQLLRSACDRLDDFPLTHAVVEQAVREVSNSFERALDNPEFYDDLRQIDEAHDLVGITHKQVLLYNFSVLEYLNAEPWYAVNPTVRLLKKFKAPCGKLQRSR